MSWNLSRVARLILVPAAGVGLVLLTMGQVRRASESGAASARTPNPDAEARITAEGHLVAYPGAEVGVGSELKSKVLAVPVEEGRAVRKGELLVELKSDEARAALGEARARVAQAEADIKYYTAVLARTRNLVRANLDAQQNLDRCQRDADAAVGRRDEAAATAQRIEAQVEKTRVLSPIDGVVIGRYVDPGETVDEGTVLVRVADMKRTRVEAEVDEYDAGRVRLDDPVQITAEGYPGLAWKGHVEEIPHAVVERHLKSQDPGRPTDTGVLRVKIALDGPSPLKLGQRVEVDIQ
jgi:HlyD family secretion protein